MDEITKQIQQLKVTGNRHNYGEAPAFLKESKGPASLDDGPECRKSAPSVPPKPNKKSPNYIEQITSVSGDSSTNLGGDGGEEKLPFLLRKQNTYGQSGKLMAKVTLDNPDVLEQQLEALEHHKKQLQRRGKLAPSPATNYQLGGNYDTSHRPNPTRSKPLQNYSLINDATYVNVGSAVNNGTEILEGGNTNEDTISSLHPLNCADSSPLGKKTNNSNNNNLSTKTHSNVNLPPLTINNNNNNNSNNSNTIINNNNGNNNGSGNFYSNIIYEPKCIFGASGNYVEESSEDLLPPSSPVSSSYSELRHATTEDIFRTNNANLKSYQCNTKAARISSPQSSQPPPPPIIDYAQLDMNYGNCNVNNQHSISSDLYFENKDNAFNRVTGGFRSQDNKPYSLDYYVYDGLSQNSSTYESIYEPINPQPTALHPSSQLNTLQNSVVGNVAATVYKLNENLLGKGIDHASATKRIPTTVLTTPSASTNSMNSSTYLLSANNPLMNNHNNMNSNMNNNNNGNTTKTNVDAKVETLNDYLMQPVNHSSASDLESYGICFKCNERVVGENSGCTAMGQIYHIICFTCSQCQINLQGKPFYALDGKPYCEYDYLQTLEKCSVCMTPILERILRATGKPFHPQCFTCVVCKKSLDGIPFTVDAINQNYCIEDFHKKFAPRCCVCKGPIMPKAGEDETVRVVALDRSFHFECYKCEDCGLLLSSEADGCGCYPLDDHVLCKNCNAKRVQMLTDHMTAEL